MANSENPVYPKKAKCADVFNGYKIVPKQRYKAITLLNHNGRLRLTVIIHVNNAKISIHRFKKKSQNLKKFCRFININFFKYKVETKNIIINDYAFYLNEIKKIVLKTCLSHDWFFFSKTD